MPASLPLEVFQSLVADSTARCRALKERCAALSCSEFASESPRQLSELISRVAGAVEEELQSLLVRYGDSPVDILAQVQVADDLVKDLGAELRYVDGAVTAKLPWSLPQPLEDLMGRVLPGRTIMLRPQWKYNYSIHIDEVGTRYRQQIRQLLRPEGRDERLQGIFAAFPAGFHLVSFPSLERKNVLLHCDVGHEMGHLMAEQYLNGEAKDYVAVFATVVAEQGKEEQKRDQLPPLWHQRRIAERLDFLLAARRRGLEEIISDLFGVLLFGPASVFALLAFAASQVLDKVPDGRSGLYPPWRTRLRYALDYLERSRPLPDETQLSPENQRVIAQVRAALQGIREMVTDKDDLRAIEGNDLTRIAYESIDQALPTARTHLENSLAGKTLDTRVLYEQALTLVTRLRAAVMPNEVRPGEPAQLESILNAGWFYRVAYLRTNPMPGAPDLRILHRLTLRATELAHVHRRYLQWKARGNDGSPGKGTHP